MNQATETADQGVKAFDLIIEGVGYLNRVRVVPVRKGPSYVACTINSMMGLATDVEYLSIDCIIVGQQALAAVEMLKQAVADRCKVIVGFRVGDPKPESYEFVKDGVPQQREGLKGRLLQLTFAKIDGVTVDIPLVHRPSQDKSQQHGDSETGSACEDASVVQA